jgi:cbb3-type cytochrome oxidase subunit 1
LNGSFAPGEVRGMTQAIVCSRKHITEGEAGSALALVALAGTGYLLGITQSKEYAEPEWYTDRLAALR